MSEESSNEPLPDEEPKYLPDDIRDIIMGHLNTYEQEEIEREINNLSETMEDLRIYRIETLSRGNDLFTDEDPEVIQLTNQIDHLDDEIDSIRYDEDHVLNQKMRQKLSMYELMLKHWRS